MQHIRINGIRMGYVDTGKGAAVLLLHGLGGSHDEWRMQIPVFAARHRVIVPDLRGCGVSERREPFTIPQHARDISALLAALAIEHIHVIGLSMGGAAAIEFALRKPEVVRSLVLVNTAPGFTLTSWQRRRMAWLRVLLALVLGVKGVARVSGKAMFPARNQGRLRKRFIRAASHTSRWAYLATLRTLTRWNAEARLHSIRAPTLVIGAEHDLTTSAEKRRWCARIPHARFVEFPASHHHSEQDSPERFNREVLAFLAHPSH